MTVLSFTSDRLASSQSVLQPQREESFLPFRLGQVGVHECVESRVGDMGALTGFALTNVQPEGAVLWVRQYKLTQEYGMLLPSGTAAFQRAVQHSLHVQASKRMDALWAIEEGIKSGAVSLVIGEVEDADFTATRRLKLASERYGVPVVLLMPHTREGISACETRWRISTQPSSLNSYDIKGLGRPQWQATLERCRIAPERVGEVFDLEYDDEALSVRVVSRMASRSFEATKTPTITREAITIRETA